MRIIHCGITLLAILPGVLSGCSKKEGSAAPSAETGTASKAPTTPKGGEVLPGASDIREALAKKDYDRAVGGVIALQNLLSTEAQRSEYNSLFQEIRDTLIEKSPTDRKAAEAMAQLRAIRMGR